MRHDGRTERAAGAGGALVAEGALLPLPWRPCNRYTFCFSSRLPGQILLFSGLCYVSGMCTIGVSRLLPTSSLNIFCVNYAVFVVNQCADQLESFQLTICKADLMTQGQTQEKYLSD